MKVQSIGKTVNFRSGLNRYILNLEQKINSEECEKYFKTFAESDFGAFHNTDFKDNKAIALASVLCSEIFVDFRNKADYRDVYSRQALVTPQDIYAFNQEDFDICKRIPQFSACMKDFKMGDKKVFCPGTVLIENNFSSLKEIDNVEECNFQKQFVSSNHFLGPFIHEWIHAIEAKLIRDICWQFNANYEQIIENIFNQRLSDGENEVVKSVLGEYAATPERGQYFEVLAEAWRKFICNSLSSRCKLIKNPIEEMKKTPKEFQEILKKVSDISLLKI